MKLGWTAAALAGAFMLLGTGAALAAEPLGLWRDSDGTTIRIARCGHGAVRNDRQHDAAERPGDRLSVDRQAQPRPDQARRAADRPAGVHQHAAERPGKWSGTLYNTDDGRSLRGNLVDRGPDILRVEGCVGTRCGGENLSRREAVSRGLARACACPLSQNR